MNVWNGLASYPANAAPTVATIGNYDGVHLGHRAILDEVVAAARTRGLLALVVTFDPHPLSVLAPQRAPRLIQSRRQKLDALGDAGVDEVLILAFDASVAALSGEAFFREYLGSRVRLAAVRVGSDFRFGNGRSGDLDTLRRIGAQDGFEVLGVPPVEFDGETISSSAVRRAIHAGDMEQAARMLGRPFVVAGEVVPGDGRGRSIGFPTANVAPENETLPRRGVYVTETLALAARWPSVTNVGVRPTVGGEATVVEAHLLDFDDDLYGERVEVRFLARLRDERKFSDLGELADQIARDRAAAVAYFQGFPIPAR
jgi:riboflavin kinase/FMN adenylyltransferase